MADPQTTGVGFYQPTRGSDSGTWDLPVNANSGALDGLFSNVATISLSSGLVTLTAPPNSGSLWSGPYQSQSACLKFIGALAGNVQVVIPRPGFYIVQNLCTSAGFPAGGLAGTAYVQLVTGLGAGIGIPPGKKCHVFNDGTNMDFVDMPDSGTFYNLAGTTNYPSWMTACSVLPYLFRDGGIYNNSQFPTLAGILGNAFGGTPGLTFAVPDSRARADIAYDRNGTGRLTAVINGSAMNSQGGNQFMQVHNHAASSSDSGHNHGVSGGVNGGTGSVFVPQASPTATVAGPPATIHIQNGFANITTSIGNAGAGGSQNIQPSIVSYLPLIKT